MGHRCWRYRANGSEIESVIFEDSDSVPDGWFDSPAKVTLEPKPKRKRRTKAEMQAARAALEAEEYDDDSEPDAGDSGA